MEKLKIDVFEIVKKLEIAARDLVTTKIIGNYRSVFKGHGLEFEGFEDYTPGDDSRLIDWKSSKKANRLLIKNFKEERNLSTLFLIDASSTMVCSSIEKLKNEYAAEFVASLSYIMLDVGDSVGFALFSDTIIKKLPPARRRHQFYAILRNLANPLFYGGDYDLGNALKFTMNFLEKNSVVIIVSDFIGLKGEWQKYLEIAAGKFDIIGVMIKDPVDEVLPEEQHHVMLKDPISGKNLLVVPDQIRERYGEYVKNQKRLIRSAFLKSNCDFVELFTDKSFIVEIIKFLKKRERRRK